MPHRRAVILMVLVTLMWSIAGVVTRHLDAARSFEVTFWRSLFNALALLLIFGVMRGPALWRGMATAGWLLWASGLCWATMFTAFMVALTLTSVANVLVTMAAAPLVAALLSRAVLKEPLPARTWLAIVLGALGIAWMFARELGGGVSFAGTLVAVAVPLAAAANWTLIRAAQRGGVAHAPDMLPAVLVGALLSALMTLPLAWPMQASLHDLGLLAVLGVVQLAIPCLLVVRVARELPAPELALLALLEVLFGVLWAWLGANERPSAGTLTGGLLLLSALVVNEVMALKSRR